MKTVHLSEAELAQDLHAVLARAQTGLQVVIEQDHRPIAVLKAARAAHTPSTSPVNLRNSVLEYIDPFEPVSA
ncbi:MAG: hypothetical protein ABI693_13570 [Bryobacteraceae bacterium]